MASNDYLRDGTDTYERHAATCNYGTIEGCEPYRAVGSYNGADDYARGGAYDATDDHTGSAGAMGGGYDIAGTYGMASASDPIDAYDAGAYGAAGTWNGSATPGGSYDSDDAWGAGVPRTDGAGATGYDIGAYDNGHTGSWNDGRTGANRDAAGNDAKPPMGERAGNALDGMKDALGNVVEGVKETFAGDRTGDDTRPDGNDTITYNQIHDATPDPAGDGHRYATNSTDAGTMAEGAHRTTGNASTAPGKVDHIVRDLDTAGDDEREV